MNETTISELVDWLKNFTYFSRLPVRKAAAVVGPCSAGKTSICYEAIRRCDLRLHTLSVIDTYDYIDRRLTTDINGYQCSFSGGLVKQVLLIDDVDIAYKSTRILDRIIRAIPGLGMPVLFTSTMADRQIPKNFRAMLDIFEIVRPLPDAIYKCLVEQQQQKQHKQHKHTPEFMKRISIACNGDIRQAKLLMVCETDRELDVCIADNHEIPHTLASQLREMVDAKTNVEWDLERLINSARDSHQLNDIFSHHLKHVSCGIDEISDIADAMSSANIFVQHEKGRFSTTFVPAIIACSSLAILIHHRPPPPVPPPPPFLTWKTGAVPKPPKRTRRRDTKKYKQLSISFSRVKI